MVHVSRLERRVHLGVALTMTLAVHAGLWLIALRIEPPAMLPVRREIELSIEQAQGKPLEPAPLPAPKLVRAAQPKKRVAARSASLQQALQPIAAPVIARAIEPSGPLDFTSETTVTTTAHAYARGAGDGSAPARAGDGHAASPVAPRAVDASRPVSLSSRAWSCPWPAQADAERIDEQTVVIRVVVDAAGNAESASLVSDPGHGFGPAAISCALRTRFTPSRDAQGTPVRAKSPPIRLRFTR